MSDPEEQRATSREQWEAAAPAWDRHGEAFARATLPVAHRMVEAIAPQPGHTVLEVGAGRGDVGFLAAELIEPGGTLIVTDGAEAMLDLARRHAERLGVRSVEFQPMELEWLDRPTASVDGLLGRFAYMLVVDPETALREARRVLKPGGRLALAVWAPADHNPWLTVAGQEVRRAASLPDPKPGEPGAFTLSEPGALEELLDATGFDDVLVEPVDLVFEAPSVDEWWDTLRETSISVRSALQQLSPAAIYRLRDAVDARWAPYVRDDGTVAIPGRALVASASA